MWQSLVAIFKLRIPLSVSDDEVVYIQRVKIHVIAPMRRYIVCLNRFRLEFRSNEARGEWASILRRNRVVQSTGLGCCVSGGGVLDVFARAFLSSGTIILTLLMVAPRMVLPA